MGACARIRLSRGGCVCSVDIRTPRIRVNAAAVFPSERKHVIEVVGNANQQFRAAHRGGDGVEEEVGLGGRSDDVTVAVCSITKHRPGNVCTVTVVVFGIVAAGVEVVIAACRWGCWERENSGDVVTEIGVHVGVVDSVVKTRIGHRDDDA